MTSLVTALAPDPQFGLTSATGTVTLTPHASKKHWWRAALQVSGMKPGDYPSVLVSHVAENDAFASTVRAGDDGTGAARFTVDGAGDGTFVGYFSTSEYTEDPYRTSDGRLVERRIVSVTVMGRYPDENLYGTFT